MNQTALQDECKKVMSNHFPFQFRHADRFTYRSVISQGSNLQYCSPWPPLRHEIPLICSIRMPQPGKNRRFGFVSFRTSEQGKGSRKRPVLLKFFNFVHSVHSAEDYERSQRYACPIWKPENYSEDRKQESAWYPRSQSRWKRRYIYPIQWGENPVRCIWKSM